MTPTEERPTAAADATSTVRTGDVASVRAYLDQLSPDRLRTLAGEAQRILEDDGVTYHPHTTSPRAARADHWRLDPLPLIIGAEEWSGIEAGVVQRAELLNLVLSDLYGPRELLRTGVLPPEVVFAHPGFLRAVDGVRLPGAHQLTVAATDLVQDGAGSWRPISDRTQMPSGAAYALENRSAVARLVPALHRAAGVERLAPYVRSLRSALHAAAPPSAEEPRIGVLTTGTRSETAFEHAHLAGLLGTPLVEGPDLAIRDGRLWLKAIGGEPVALDVLLRRVDAWWCDPLELRADSRLGTPGLVEATRHGGLSVCNHLGAGVLENAALQAFLPTLSRRLLGQDLRLEPARTLWCGEPDQRAEVLARLDQLVVKRIARTGETEPVDVARLERSLRERLLASIQAHPHRWVGQERIDGVEVPSVTPTGTAVRARSVLRTFCVARGDSYVAMRGGLTRVSDADRLVIASTTGAWSKDTWVLGGDREVAEGFWLREGPRLEGDAPENVVSARAVENLLWLGRYAERAEAMVRLLRAIDDRRTDVGGGTGALVQTVDRLLVALTRVTATGPGFEDRARLATPEEELTTLVLDVERVGTLAFAVERLSDAAHAVRDQLSSDTWPVLTALEREVLGDEERAPALTSGEHGPPFGRAALGRVLTPLLALQGLGAESLVRDPSWLFLEAGRRLERGQQLLGLLRATVTTPADATVLSLLLESVLIATESVITYRRRTRSRAQLSTVLELLLLDRNNPRSLRWQLDRLADVLPQLPGHPGAGAMTPVEDVVHTLSSTLHNADLETLAQDPPGLTGMLDHLEQLLQRAGSELSRTIFVPVPASRPMVDERVGTAGDVLLA